MSGEMHSKIRLTIYNDYNPEARGFGRGIVLLLEKIEKTGSIKKAALEMGMAYSKAWKVITAVEREFSIKLLEREGHKGSTLSPQARMLLDAYKNMLSEIDKVTDDSFKRHFKDLRLD